MKIAWAKGQKSFNKYPFFLLLVLSLLNLLLGCSESSGSGSSIDSSAGSKPNIIMIVVDTLRADHLSSYGYARNTDPHIVAFVQQAVLFRNAIAPAPWTTPSYTSILEGKLAFNHNMNSAGAITAPDGVILTSYLRGAGYKTVAIQTNNILSFLGLGDYFDELYLYTDESAIEFLDQGAIDKATQWIDADNNTANKFFLFIGMMSPHWRYDPNTGFLEEFVGDAIYNSTGPMPANVDTTHRNGCWTYSMLSSELQVLVGKPVTSTGYYEDARLYIAGYDSEIKYADNQIGRLLQELKNKGLYDDSLIIITADHGEDMVDHTPIFGHQDNLYQSLLHVPLLIKFPRQTNQRIITDVVRTIDILPTVFDYSYISYDGTDGKSLLPVINGEEVNYDERPVISYRVLTDGSGNEEVSLIKDGYKLIRNRNNSANSLYNLTDDPGETTDISARQPDTVSSLKGFLGKFFTRW